ncbi:hypothetical protein [Thauera sp.]|uniref:hypothetical protein n=1 Tax=Thauera sp. TaxID=1905334 RepID=UPI0039E4DC05
MSQIIPQADRKGAQYFVLDLTQDPFARKAAKAYAKACKDEYPQLAADIRAQIDRVRPGDIIDVPETTLPNGRVVPAFRIDRSHATRRADGRPWVRINYHEAIAAAAAAGGALIAETQALAIAHQIAQQPENWTGGAVGAGKIFQGLHKGAVTEVQLPGYESDDPEERRWHVLANGARIYDFAGHLFSWVADDVQGDENGLVARAFAEDSPSITTAPHARMEKGMGWYPPAGRDWSGNALLRGGYWDGVALAGVFGLGYGWPAYRGGDVGFRCTYPLPLIPGLGSLRQQ